MSSPPRPSKFIEGSPSTPLDLLSQPAIPNELFYTILNEMDELESKKRRQYQHRGSQSSADSLPSPSGSSPTITSYPYQQYYTKTGGNEVVDRRHTVREGRRSINFTRTTLYKELEVEGGKRRKSGSVSGSDVEGGGHAGNNKLKKRFVGRLRALTAGRDGHRDGHRDVKPYAGT